MSELDQLESKAEAQRALFAEAVDGMRVRIADTADDLRERISPEHIVHRTGEKWRNFIETSARDNPIEAAGFAVLLAYPLWRMTRAIPLPMAIAGAAVLLARQARLNPTLVSELLADTRVQADIAVGRLAHATEQVRDEAAHEVREVGSQAKAASYVIQGAARSAAANVSEHLGYATDSASTAFSNALEAVTPSEATIQSLKDGAHAAADKAKDITSHVASSSAAYSRGAVNAIAENPMLVAGLGLAAGGLLAAVLPRSKADSQLGGLASTVQKSAERALKEGRQAATKTITDLYDHTVNEVEAVGLTAGAVTSAAEDIKQQAGDHTVEAVTKRNKTIPESRHD